jgi:oxalate decarboxylase/phosphoglucose isomerase-like protein (cupin superfamily)
LLFGEKHWYLTPPGDFKKHRRQAKPEHVQLWLDNPKAYAAYKHEQVLTECIQREGQLLFIPRGWGHATRNAQPTLAVANEFCNCEKACCGQTCSATAALAGDATDLLDILDQTNQQNMAALQTAIASWRSLSTDLQ